MKGSFCAGFRVVVFLVCLGRNESLKGANGKMAEAGHNAESRGHYCVSWFKLHRRMKTRNKEDRDNVDFEIGYAAARDTPRFLSPPLHSLNYSRGRCTN